MALAPVGQSCITVLVMAVAICRTSSGNPEVPAGARHIAGIPGRLEQLQPPVGQPPLICVRHQVSTLRFLGLERRAGSHLCPVISHDSDWAY